VTEGSRQRRRGYTGKRRWLRRALYFALGLLGGGGLMGCCVFSAPRYQGPVSDHFDGSVFVNQKPIEHGGVIDFLGWQLTSDRGPWEEMLDAPPGPPPPKQVGPGQVRVTFIGHATPLVQMDGVNIITDPIYSDHASPLEGVGPRRYRPPGIRFEDLPPIHAVVVSHNHYDHLDLPTLRRLHADHEPRMFVGLGNKQLLERAGIDDVMELDWWQSAEVGGLRVFSTPAQHFSGRGLCDRDATLWTGFVFRGRAGVVYFAGDTGMGPHFEQVRDRFGPPRLAIVPIGAYLPRWFMERVHIDPAEAVRAHRLLGAQQSVGMHFGTFALADEGMDQAPTDLAAALADQRVDPERFWVLGFGEGRDLPPANAMAAR